MEVGSLVIFVTGAHASGKRSFVQSLGCSEDGVAYEVQLLLESGERDVDELARELMEMKFVTCSELGQGIVPAAARDRAWRDRAGRLACLLAAEAECVVRMVCGIPLVIKGRIPGSILSEPSRLSGCSLSGASENADGASFSKAQFANRNAVDLL